MQTNSFDLLRRRQVYPKQATHKKGSAIEYVSKNRIFTDADDYSMEIELPLADCPQDLDVYVNVSNTIVQQNNELKDLSIVYKKSRPKQRSNSADVRACMALLQRGTHLTALCRCKSNTIS